MKKVQKYIVRCHLAGVFYGEVVKHDKDEITMRDVRKIG